MARQCIACDHQFEGRADKRYCSDACRFLDHNNRKRENPEARLMVSINNILKKNRRILKLLNPCGKITLHRELLEQQGFHFNYFTHLYRSKKGYTYYFCYDYGYLLLDEEKILVVTWQHGSIPVT